MRKISVLLVLFGLIASSLTPVVSAQSGIIITCDNVQILGSGEIVFDVTNTRSTKTQISVSSIFYSLESQGMKVNAMHEWKELPYTVSVADYGTRLIEVYDNETGQYVTVEETYITGYHDETHYKWDWKPTKMHLIDGKSTQPKSDLITIGRGKTKTFKFDVTKKAELNGDPIKFDIVVVGDGFREVLDPWVCVDWNRRAPLQINNTGCATALSYHPVYMNLTYDPDMNSNFSDIRIVNDTAEVEVPLWNMTVVDGVYAEIYFNVSSIPASSWLNNTYYVYYNNSEATTSSNIKTTFPFGDDFKTDDWTDVGTEFYVDTTNESIYGKTYLDADEDLTYASLGIPVTGVFDYSFSFKYLDYSANGAFFGVVLSEAPEDYISAISNSHDQVGILLLRTTATGIYKIQDGAYDSAGWWGDASSDTVYHAHIKRIGNTLYLYIYDDAAHTTQLYTNSIAYSGTATLNYFAVVGSHDNTAPTNYIEAEVDDLILWKRASPEPDVVVGTEEIGKISITSWYNSKTQNNSLSFSINETEEVYFNASAEVYIDTWMWFKDGVNQANNNDSINLSWDYYISGLKTVGVYAYNNTHGQSNTTTWNVIVNGTYIFDISAKNEDTDATINSFTATLNAVEKSTGSGEILYNTTGLSANTEYELKTSATGFLERKFYITTPTIPPTLQDVVVYLLATDDGAYIRFHISDGAGYVVQDAKVVAKKSGTIVGEDKTDASGVMRLFLDPTTQYQIEVSKTGYTTTVYIITPTSSDYYIAFGAAQPIVVPVSDVTWILKPTTTSIRNESITFTFNTSSPRGKIQYWGMKIENETTTLSDQTWTNATGGRMSAMPDFTNYSSGDKIYVTVKVKESGITEKSEMRTYYIYECVEPEGISLFTILQDLGDTLDDFTKVFISLIMTLFVVGCIVKYVSAGAFGGGILALISLGFFTYIGWFPWLLMLLVGMVTVGLYGWMK